MASIAAYRIEMDLHKVRAAKTESKMRIMERQEEIRKIEESLALQEQKEAELEAQLNQLK